MNRQALLASTSLIADREGFSSTPYQDQGGTWTIAFGSTYLLDGSRVCATTPPMTRQQGLMLLQNKVSWYAQQVQEFVTVELQPNQWAALVSFAYNEGVEALKTSTLLRELDAGDTGDAVKQFVVWDMVRENGVLTVDQGLLNRREFEQQVFLGQQAIPGLDQVAAELDVLQSIAPKPPVPASASVPVSLAVSLAVPETPTVPSGTLLGNAWSKVASWFGS